MEKEEKQQGTKVLGMGLGCFFSITVPLTIYVCFCVSVDNLIDQTKVAKSEAKAVELEKKVEIGLGFFSVFHFNLPFFFAIFPLLTSISLSDPV